MTEQELTAQLAYFNREMQRSGNPVVVIGLVTALIAERDIFKAEREAMGINLDNAVTQLRKLVAERDALKGQLELQIIRGGKSRRIRRKDLEQL